MQGQNSSPTTYAVVPQSRWPIQPGRDAILAALTVFVAFTATVVMIWRASIAHQADGVLAETVRIAEVAAGLVDTDLYKSLAPGAGSDHELYNLETRRLAYLKGTQSRLEGLYTLSRKGDQWVVVLDAQRRSEFGSRVFPPAALEAYTTRQSCQSDRFDAEIGALFSVFSPIKDLEGNVIGVVGADLLASKVRNRGGRTDQVLVYGMLFTLACMIGMGALVYRLRSTMRDVMMAQETRMVALERSAETLARAQEQAGSMLASMSHEVRTPLTAILGFTELLLEPNDDVAVLRGHAQTIRRNSQHLLGVLNDALDISKIDAGMMSIHARPFDPRLLMHEVIDLFGPRAKEKHITLTCVADGELPECVDADEFRVRQILLNLLSNGLKFTEHGGVTAIVRYDTATRVLEYVVTDTGVGIAPDQFEHIFKPYRQALNEDVRRFGGTGLGLAISKRLATLLQGELTVTSRPGFGSTFTMRIPAPTMTAEVCEEREVSAPGESWRPRPSWRVLVAEDTLEHQKILYAMLRRAGHSVDVCETGERALKLVVESEDLREPYTVIVLDAHLPGMSGSATARAVREHGFRGPILALTADQTDETRAACLIAGCNEVLSKPTDSERLLSALSRLVHGSKSLGVA